ncbi:uncharacterized protein HMPREF1541_04670 [Cyphellophora europaea CBS 101466]|uniref:Initiator tRNA phosphoribosyl transferase n=1 Tax=Cyphellophora europaea (strain CBS 101466) TaxID=1220924 RepID=W2RXB5_CYPE1|nr:uncharacterized protein HMPREF1541_04670 [Cyphellophora europaea CBS 101466]ETN40393.1 hypothetical protein HMPREF1541_04670 [Cyphellophora europaea CBS 101466]
MATSLDVDNENSDSDLSADVAAASDTGNENDSSGAFSDSPSTSRPPAPAPTTPFPTHLSDLAPQETLVPNLYKTLHALHQHTLAPLPRLRSIATDAAFVTSLRRATGLPLIANERCGAWYIPPALKAASAYFKSTDGHYGQWAFSLRRLNLQVLDVLGAQGGGVLVDSTRRGKAWPDALRRTVPLWVAVVDNVLWGGRVEEGGDGRGREGLQTPEGEEGVGESERAQVEARLAAWEGEFRGLGLDLGELRRRVKRRIRCVWVANGAWEPDGWAEKIRGMGDFNVLVLASASRRVRGAEMSEGGYVQGAGDDSEGWARGLTSQLWWENKDRLLAAGEGDVEDMIGEIVATAKATESVGQGTRIEKASNLFVGAGRREECDGFDLVINCQGGGKDGKSLLNLKCREGKLGSKDLRDKLASAKDVAGAVLQQNPHSRILVTCSSGKDLSIGTALSLICLFFSDTGELNAARQPYFIDKMVIKQRLVWISSCKSDANPSRATLQAVNSFLIDRPG